MSKQSPSGNPAGLPKSSIQADPASTGMRAARPGEAGSAGISGAPPSNTAPHNCNSLPDGFRLLRLAVDSLYLSFPGQLFPSVQERLQKLKSQAQSEHLEVQALAQYSIGSHVFEVKDKGARLYPYVLDDNAYRIQFSRNNKRLPMAYVKVSAKFLAYQEPAAVLEELTDLLSLCGNLTGSEVVSRIDLAADFSSPCVMDSWHRAAWVTRASRIDQHSEHQQFTGWSIGMGGPLAARLYDKTKEIEFSDKQWFKELWRPAGWQDGQEVWRLEFEFKRDFLKERKLFSLASVLDNLNGLWSYATTEWLRLTVPSDSDTTRARWPTHRLWMDLASVDWESAQNARLRRFSNTRPPDKRRLYALVQGSLASYMAIHQLDDKNAAIDGLLGEMHQHFQDIAYQMGVDADELLLRKARARARLFNTNDNTTDDSEESPGARAYRRASRGE